LAQAIWLKTITFDAKAKIQARRVSLQTYTASFLRASYMLLEVPCQATTSRRSPRCTWCCACADACRSLSSVWASARYEIKTLRLASFCFLDTLPCFPGHDDVSVKTGFVPHGIGWHFCNRTHASKFRREDCRKKCFHQVPCTLVRPLQETET